MLIWLLHFIFDSNVSHYHGSAGGRKMQLPNLNACFGDETDESPLYFRAQPGSGLTWKLWIVCASVTYENILPVPYVLWDPQNRLCSKFLSSSLAWDQISRDQDLSPSWCLLVVITGRPPYPQIQYLSMVSIIYGLLKIFLLRGWGQGRMLYLA